MAKQLPYSTMVEIFRRFRAAEPEPKGELEHVNAYTLVVAVALSAQATDAGVNKATRALFQVADTPQKMLDLGEERLIEHIKTIGLFRNKAKNVMKLSRILVEEYGGEVPSSRAALQSLPGVGRKTANVVLNMWWGIPRRRSTPISSASATARASRRARTSTPSSAPSRTMSPPSSSATRITG
jgi:endonuclease-3